MQNGGRSSQFAFSIFHFSFFNAALFSEIQLHRLARALELADHANLLCGVEVNLVLGDLLNHDRHLVLRALIDQRPAARVELNQPLLNQRAELEPSADLVDDRLFFQGIEHCVSLACFSSIWQTSRTASCTSRLITSWR